MGLFDSAVAPALQAVSGIISQFHLSPEDKVKADAAVAAATAQAKEAADEYEVNLNQIAG